jgi:hypothetical protein
MIRLSLPGMADCPEFPLGSCPAAKEFRNSVRLIGLFCDDDRSSFTSKSLQVLPFSVASLYMLNLENSNPNFSLLLLPTLIEQLGTYDFSFARTYQQFWRCVLADS